MSAITAPDDASAWAEALTRCQRGEPEATVRAIIRSYEDGTRASLVLTDNRKAQWIKVLGNPQGDQILVTEAVVSGAGRLIHAPTRPTSLIRIPDQFSGVAYGPVSRFIPGIAHASLHLDQAEERDTIDFPRRGGNEVRRASLAGLWDWCMGDDAQWLYDLENDYAIWSFDHGFWLGGDGGDWDAHMLRRLVTTPWQMTEGTSTLSSSSLRYCASELRRVSVGDILGVLAGVPREWGSSDEELGTLGWFLYARRSGVADRLEGLATSLEDAKEVGK